MIFALADDLTGALEVGVKLGGDALVIDTETRHSTPESAAAHIRALAANHPADIVYKKTDSLLRGNIGAELEALAACYPSRPIVYIPAYPELGRTVKDGRLYVHGKLFADVGHHGADSETEGEVAQQVAAALRENPSTILCGPANVAGHLARALGLPRQNRPVRPLGRCLVVNGSLHEASAAQIRHGIAQDWPGWSFVPQGFGHRPEGAFDTLVVFGGETAYLLLSEMGITELEPLREIVPGVPVSRAGNLQLITKAGAFGPPDVLTRIRNAMNEQ